MKQKSWALALTVGLLNAGGAAQAGLMAYTVNGVDLAYDTKLDITWATNAGLSGFENWADLMSWAANLDYAGYDGWRLASMSTSAATDSVHDCSSGTEQACIDSGNELGYMYYYNLGGSIGDDKTGDQTVGGVDLTGIQSVYWSGTERKKNPDDAWYFYTDGGDQYDEGKDSQYYGWAVRLGQIAAAPLPGTALLMALGFAAMAVSRRARRRFW